MSMWLEVAKSILQERLAEAERERVAREAIAERDTRSPRREPTLARLRGWLAAWPPDTQGQHQAQVSGRRAAMPHGGGEGD
jgi:hypothetical protein